MGNSQVWYRVEKTESTNLAEVVSEELDPFGDFDARNGSLHYMSMPVVTCITCGETSYTSEVIEESDRVIDVTLLEKYQDSPVVGEQEYEGLLNQLGVERDVFLPGCLLAPGTWWMSLDPVDDFYFPISPIQGMVISESLRDKVPVVARCNFHELRVKLLDGARSSSRYYQMIPIQELVSDEWSCGTCKSRFHSRYSVIDPREAAGILNVEGVGVVVNSEIATAMEDMTSLQMLRLTQREIQRMNQLMLVQRALGDRKRSDVEDSPG